MQQLKSIQLLHPVYFFSNQPLTASQDEGVELLIQTGDQFIGFLLFNPSTKKVVVWSFYQMKETKEALLLGSELQQLEQEHKWMKAGSKKITIVNYASRNVLVPSVLNRQNSLDAVYDLMLGTAPDELRLQEPVSAMDAVMVHAVPLTVYQLLQQNYPGAVWHHLKSVLLKKEAASDACITVSVYFNQVFITLEKNKTWQLLQNWHYQTPEDVLYYVLNCIEQYNLSAETTEIRLEGMIDKQSALANTLHQYLGNLVWNRTLLFEYPQEANTFSLHTLALPDRILACVS